MDKMPEIPQQRTGLHWYQKILLFLMTLVGIACIGGVALLHFGYSIPGVKLPALLNFILPNAGATPTPYYTPTITPTFTITPITTATFTRTAVPSNTMAPTRTKAPTWTLLPMLITPSATPVTPTVTGTPPTDTPTDTPTP
jgi:hypothetical protein